MGKVALVVLSSPLLCICIAGVLVFRSLKTTVNPLKPEPAPPGHIGGTKLRETGTWLFGVVFWFPGHLLGSMWPVTGVLGFVLYLTRFQIIPAREVADLYPLEANLKTMPKGSPLVDLPKVIQYGKVNT